MAMSDSRYCFTLVDIENIGRDNDAHIFNNSMMGKAFINDEPNVPSPREVDGYQLPFVIVSDEIFALKPWLMKPYGGKGLPQEEEIFNYRLSCCRRTIENNFGILTARWRIFRQPIKAKPETVDSITKACLCLHNYLRLTSNAQYIPSGFVDSEDSSGNIIPGDWRRVTEGACAFNVRQKADLTTGHVQMLTVLERISKNTSQARKALHHGRSSMFLKRRSN